jgi:hypothetical protein
LASNRNAIHLLAAENRASSAAPNSTVVSKYSISARYDGGPRDEAHHLRRVLTGDGPAARDEMREHDRGDAQAARHRQDGPIARGLVFPQVTCRTAQSESSA